MKTGNLSAMSCTAGTAPGQWRYTVNDGMRVLSGSGSGLLDAADWYNWGTNSQWVEYLPDENVIRIHYTREKDGFGYKDYAVDFEELNMSRYEEDY